MWACWFGQILRHHESASTCATVCRRKAPESTTGFCGDRSIYSIEMKQSAQELAEFTGSSEVAVTFDGTWMRRGFSSLLSVCARIGFRTGRVLDMYVGSKYCQECVIWSDKLDKSAISQERFDEWKAQHSCKMNTTKSSAAMEMEGACAIWKRSQETRGLKYTTYISDGDSKSYMAVCSENPYPILQCAGCSVGRYTEGSSRGGCCACFKFIS